MSIHLMQKIKTTINDENFPKKKKIVRNALFDIIFKKKLLLSPKIEKLT